MKVVYNGVVESSQKGCSVCGGRKTRKTFQFTKEYILPSGIQKKFRVGLPTDVSDSDGEFLLSYTTRQGEKVFTNYDDQ